MHRLALVVLFLPIALLAADRTPGPLPPQQAAKNMVLPDGFRATLFAAEPDVVQPISFCIDDRGRLIVAEALNYGAWQATGKDRIVILEDTDGDGRADSRKVFYEGFNYITGIEQGFGGVWVMSPPGLYFVPDRNGDDKPDGPPVLYFDGIGYKESRHNLANGFTWGPDGWLYFGHGRTSPSEFGRPGTPAEKRIHCDGGVCRIHPTRLVFENFADGTTNPWGVDFDDYGQCFVSNCVNPHLFHMIQGGHYEPWRNRPSSLYAYERLPTIADHLHYQGSDLKATLGTSDTLALGGGHAHCGTMIYLGDSFPEKYRNTAFMCNVHGRRINNDILKPKGSGYTASHGKDFMISADPWFMGVTLQTGPDGSVFVSDWSDTGECHTYKPDTKSGRIYKIAFGDKKAKPVDMQKLSNKELVELQLHKNDWFVRHARRLLQERSLAAEWTGVEVRNSLLSILNSDRDTPQRLRALWALHVFEGDNYGTLFKLLGDRSAHLRAWVIQFLCEGRRPNDEALAKFAELAKNDPSPVVRLYLACAMQRLPEKDRFTIAEGLLSHEGDTADANLPLMIWYGLEPAVAQEPLTAMKLAVSARIPLLRQFISRRVAEESIARGDRNDLSPWVNALAGANGGAELDLLIGAREGLRGRKSMKMPNGWEAVYDRLSKSDNPAVREHAILIALIFDDPRALADLRKTVTRKEEKASARIAAVEALVAKRSSDLAPFLHGLLGDKALRRTALRGLAVVAHDDTPRLVLARYAEFTDDERHDAIATLSSRAEFALPLLDAMEKKLVPRGDVSAYAARQIFALNNAKVTERLRAVWGDVRDANPQKKEQLARLQKLMTPNFLKNANVANGKALFTKNCATCHKLFGEGGTIGPDLTGSNRSNLDYLLSNLVDPSAEVGRDYRLSIVSTSEGRTITGIIVERLPKRLVIQTATERITLATEDVESTRDSSASIMPEGQLDVLSREEVRDLIGYLSAKAQIPLPEKTRP